AHAVEGHGGPEGIATGRSARGAGGGIRGDMAAVEGRVEMVPKAARNHAAECRPVKRPAPRRVRGRRGGTIRDVWREIQDGAVLLATRRDLVVADLAERQHGVVSTAQLHAAGLGRGAVETRVARGGLHQIHRGVYAV